MGGIAMPGFARAHRSLPAMAGAMLASVLLATAAVAQSYPTAPVRVIVPFNAGGATDVLARVFIDHLQQRLGQTFTAENRGGAGGQIAAPALAPAPPGGSQPLPPTTAPLTPPPRRRHTADFPDPRADHDRTAREREGAVRPAQGLRAGRAGRGPAGLAD